MKTRIAVLLALTFFTAGCQTNSKPKISLHRGWIGGEYAEARKSTLPRGDRHRVYVSQVYESTPAAQAGLQLGDRLLSINEIPIRNTQDLRRSIDSTPPGKPVTVEFLREGTQLNGTCLAGKETYQSWRSLSFGLHISPKLDLWPDPDASIFGILEYATPDERVELRSAQVRATKPPAGKGPIGERGEAGVYSPEGWRLWLGILGMGSHRRILSQETNAPVDVLK